MHSYYFYAFSAISTKGKMDWTRHSIFYDHTNANKPDLIKAIYYSQRSLFVVTFNPICV